MLADLWTVMVKEWREVIVRGMGVRSSVGFFGLVLVVFGVALPVRFGQEWIDQPVTVLIFAWLPLMLVMAVVADSFAGERERHTLETLLASRLSDAAILLGKTAAAVGFAYGMLLLVSALSILAVNVSVARPDPWTHPLLWSGVETVGVVVIGLLLTVLCATVGVMVSLRSSTVRQASLRLSMGLIIFFPTVGFASAGIWAILPGDVQLAMLMAAETWQPWAVLLATILAFVVVDAALLLGASHLFRRDKLILE